MMIKNANYVDQPVVLAYQLLNASIVKELTFWGRVSVKYVHKIVLFAMTIINAQLVNQLILL